MKGHTRENNTKHPRKTLRDSSKPKQWRKTDRIKQNRLRKEKGIPEYSRQNEKKRLEKKMVPRKEFVLTGKETSQGENCAGCRGS
jgi:hypothetical protein